MRLERCVKLTVLFVGFAILSGCSSCVESGSKSENSANSNIVAVITPKAATNGAPISDNGNSNLVPYPGLESNENPTLDKSKVKVIDTSKLKPEPLPPRIMPDGSEIMTVQAPDGKSFIESRKFVNHQQLAKLERITKSANDRVVKVYLRNGKVITITNDKVTDFAADPASSILLAAGIKPETPQVPAPDVKDRKMDVKRGVN